MAGSQTKSSTKKTRRQGQGKRSKGIEKRPQRPIRKSARLEERQHQNIPKGQATKLKPALPSPSTSNTPGGEVPRSSSVLLKAVNSPEWTQTSAPNPKLEEIEQHGHEPIRKVDQKGKRSQDAEDLNPQLQNKPSEKRARVSSPDKAIRSEEEASDIDSENDLPIEHWRKTGSWPRKLFQPDPNMSQQLIKKRSSSAISYSQGVREGIYPTAHTPEYEKRILEPAGIRLGKQFGEAAIGDDAQKLCQTLLNATYEIPKNSLFEGDFFWKVLDSVRSEGEGEVVRDLQPDIVPSAKILFLRGLLKVNYLKETVKIPWNNVASLAGSTPCPDFTVGLLPSAFTESELDKLHRHHNTFDTPSRFTGNLYFPFFTCEAKCGANGLNEADRQNARSAATAINTILQLYRQREKIRRESEAASGIGQLHRETLFFSISHDHTRIQIFGHYPLIKEDKTYFHCHLIKLFDLREDDGGNRWTAYNFVRKLYDHFAPIHLQRIRDAIPYLPERGSESLLGTNDSQRMPPPSQNITGSKKQRTTATSTRELQLQQELERQREEAKQREDQLREESKQQLAREREESKQQLAREREESKQQLAREREESKESKQELAREREESKQQLAREKEESKQRHAELMEQNKKLMTMLEQKMG